MAATYGPTAPHITASSTCNVLHTIFYFTILIIMHTFHFPQLHVYSQRLNQLNRTNR
ncbi:hypothetical protein EG68_12642 [Paragonimus skrjabini miyazakii]|uniref:Uncharacterized protein n=1 Tax=Paragonimus skrjabini miyazakii TaxID=59628 RepID=A0A8S9YGR3_9TREM|nr:hypothetical protein EG68_12642 [Paragonimus skrjabini miyazakii]